MALLLETGSGVRGANSYINPVFVTAYLKDRGRQAENNWDGIGGTAQAAACIAGSDYIDTRWGRRLKGSREFSFDGTLAQAQLSLAGLPLTTETLTIGGKTYTFVATLTLLGADEIVIGADAEGVVDNIIAAINESTGSGITYSASLQANSSAEAKEVDGVPTSILLTVFNSGVAGNDTPLSETATNLTLDTSTFVNGLDGGSQPMEFPRRSLFDQDGRRVFGIPRNLKFAAAEYAVRAAAALLYTDPDVDSTGQTVTEKFEKIGPIEERTKYQDSSTLAQLIKPYPAADRLLQDYVLPPGRVFRG
jgi:hypothetical protein